MLDVSILEGWLWDAACQIRGPLDMPKVKDYILPLISLKRLSDVLADELDRLAEEVGDREVAGSLKAEHHGLVRFYAPPVAPWSEIACRTTGVGGFRRG
jgi:type I restriction enzyme M protein